jgi:hypothetical protein
VQAKKQAVAKFLPEAAPPPEFAALAASTARRHNIIGVGIGPKIKKGRRTARTSIRFYVEKKVPPKAVPSADMIPAKIRGIPTDVVETGRLYAQVPIAQQRVRPAMGGGSVGFKAATFVMAGTLGCVVTDGEKRYILSNNHVLANENALPLNSPIFQPGLLDNGNAAKDRIARLKKFVKIRKLPVYRSGFSGQLSVLVTLPRASSLGPPAACNGRGARRAIPGCSAR